MSYLTDVATVYYVGAIDAYSEPPATPLTQNYPCRFEYERKKQWTAEGQEVISEGLIFFPPDVAISMRDKVQFDGRMWNVIHIGRMKGKHRLSHIEVRVV